MRTPTRETIRARRAKGRPKSHPRGRHSQSSQHISPPIHRSNLILRLSSLLDLYGDRGKSLKRSWFFLFGKCSSRIFKDALAGASQGLPSFPDLKISSHRGSPALWISEEEINSLVIPFEFSLVGKFPNSRPSVDAIRKFFFNLKLNGECSVIVLNPMHVLIKLVDDLYYCRVFSHRSYFVNNCFMKLVKWSSTFDVEVESPIIPIWISFSHLQPHLFSSRILHSRISIFGWPLKTDNSILIGSHPSVARVSWWSHSKVNCRSLNPHLNTSHTTNPPPIIKNVKSSLSNEGIINGGDVVLLLFGSDDVHSSKLVVSVSEDSNVIGHIEENLCVVNASSDDLEVVDHVVTISACLVHEDVENNSLAVVLKDSLCLTPGFVWNGQYIYFYYFFKEELKAHLDLSLHEFCSNRSDWLDEHLSSHGEGEGDQLKGCDEEFDDLFNLKVNRIVEKAFSNRGGKCRVLDASCRLCALLVFPSLDAPAWWLGGC
ncbi:hypothetical protein KFK09_005288 [Dendrobium nobile]|uniref:DUF4283 domain-containing protein n=1 Tax=Dendrobium nobile TaxID=94219 RepID=A0A8T3C0H1_DENNO|nr:hypothetical protein KFK09_005288 [Dendrobium nobile]